MSEKGRAVRDVLLPVVYGGCLLAVALVANRWEEFRTPREVLVTIPVLVLIACGVSVWLHRCDLFGHRWTGCVCRWCDERRDEQHDWHEYHCRGCHRDLPHAHERDEA